MYITIFIFKVNTLFSKKKERTKVLNIIFIDKY